MKKIEKRDFNIGAYHLQPNARDEAHIKDISECKIDFIVNIDYDPKALKLLQSYGIGAIVKGVLPQHWGGDGTNSGTYAQKCSVHEVGKAAELCKEQPAIWGIDIGDEFSSLDFYHAGKVAHAVQSALPNLFAYTCIYPIYGATATNGELQIIRELGCNSYAEYVDAYCTNIPTDYICCDFYMYSCSNPMLIFENLNTLSKACRQHNKSLWMVLQVNSSKENICLSVNMLKYQAFCSFAYGAAGIIWACYGGGWWYNNVLDSDGNKTCMYDRLKAANHALLTQVNLLSGYRHIKSCLSGSFCHSSLIDKLRLSLTSNPDSNAFSDFSVSDDALLAVGLFEKDGKRAYFMFSCDDPYDTKVKNHTLSFIPKNDMYVFHNESNRAKAEHNVEQNICFKSGDTIILKDNREIYHS